MRIIKTLPILIILVFSVISSISNDKIYDISNELMCPVCQGQTVAESNSKLALSMREVVKTKLSEGKSKEEILDYFILQYGDTILAKPPVKGFNLILWIVPPISLLVALFFWISYIKRNRDSERVK